MGRSIRNHHLKFELTVSYSAYQTLRGNYGARGTCIFMSQVSSEDGHRVPNYALDSDIETPHSRAKDDPNASTDIEIQDLRHQPGGFKLTIAVPNVSKHDESSD